MRKRNSKPSVHPKTERVLREFQQPCCPRSVERKLDLKKLRTTELSQRGLLRCLNPQAKKGRLFILTQKGRECLDKGKPLSLDPSLRVDQHTLGWVMASPKQRLALLRTLGIDSVKRTSENLRKRAARFNPKLTRISTKDILKGLVAENLVETEKNKNRRFYWLSKKGVAVLEVIRAIE